MQTLKPIMPTLKTISYAQNILAKKLAVREVRFLPDDVKHIYDNTDPLTFYAISGEDDSGLIWACDGCLEIIDFVPEHVFINAIRMAFSFDDFLERWTYFDEDYEISMEEAINHETNI